MSNVEKKIFIPIDNDGFSLLKCSFCGEFFKLKPNDVQCEDVISIWCPCCGLISENYVTEDVINLAMKMAKNIACDMIFDELNKMERNFKGGGFSFKLGKKPTKEIENPIISGIEAMEIQKYKCCKKEAKIKPLVKICGGFCSYCGVGYDEFK